MKRLMISLLTTIALAFGAPAEASKFGKISFGHKSFHTYSKTHATTGKVYVGRTSGTKGARKDVAARDQSHHMNQKGYGAAVLDKSSANKAAIRGREQQMIDKQKSVNNSGNAINGISPLNKNRDHYLSEANRNFGKP